MGNFILLAASDDAFGKITSAISGLAKDIATVCVALAFVAAVICVIGYLTAKSEQKAEMFKSWGIRICLGLLILALIPTIIGTVQSWVAGERWFNNPTDISIPVPDVSQPGG